MCGVYLISSKSKNLQNKAECSEWFVQNETEHTGQTALPNNVSQEHRHVFGTTSIRRLEVFYTRRMQGILRYVSDDNIESVPLITLHESRHEL